MAVWLNHKTGQLIVRKDFDGESTPRAGYSYQCQKAALKGLVPFVLPDSHGKSRRFVLYPVTRGDVSLLKPASFNGTSVEFLDWARKVDLLLYYFGRRAGSAILRGQTGRLFRYLSMKAANGRGLNSDDTQLLAFLSMDRQSAVLSQVLLYRQGVRKNED